MSPALPPPGADGFFLRLYDHQKRAVREASAALAAQHKGAPDEEASVLVVAPTGAGKGTMAVEMTMRALSRGLRTLFVVHRGEIAEDQWERLRRAGVPAVDLIVGGSPHRDPYAPCHVGTVDSLAGPLPDLDLMIVDEAHRSLARSYASLRERARARWVCGFTATPVRLDRRPLREAWRQLVVGARPRELVEAGLLAKARVYGVEEDFRDLSDVPLRGGDYDPEALEQRYATPRLVGSIFEHWERHAGGRATIVFCTGVAKAREVAAEFARRGVAAEAVDGSASRAARRAVMERVRSGATRVVAQAVLWVEGVDLPEFKCAVLARPTTSVTVCLQSVGRVLRPWEGVDAVVIDHAGNIGRFGLPHQDRDWRKVWELPARGGPKGHREAVLDGDPAATKICPGPDAADGSGDGTGCGAILPKSAKACPECGREFGAVRHEEGDLVLLSGEPDDPAAEERATTRIARAAFERLWLEAYRDGHDAAWVTRRYAERFARAPDAGWAPPARPRVAYTPAQKNAELMKLMGVAHRHGYGHDWVARKYLAKVGEEIGAASAPVPPQLPAETPAEPAVDAAVELEF